MGEKRNLVNSPTKEIAVITQQTSGTVYVRKTSIRRKMGAEEGRTLWGW